MIVWRTVETGETGETNRVNMDDCVDWVAEAGIPIHVTPRKK
jgi:hypothetical protein